MNTYAWYAFVVAVLCVAWLRWSHRRAVQAAIEKTTTLQQELHEAAFMEGTRVLSEHVAVLQIEVERAREVAQDERDKRSRYFDQIRVFEIQRDEWKQLYFEQSAGHGNAQALMMGTIERLARDLQARGGRPQIPRVLHAIREEFEQTHTLPAREGLAALNAAAKVAADAPEAPPEAPVAS